MNYNVFDSDFSFDFYRRLLKVLASRYNILQLCQGRSGLSKDDPICYLRHDIDLSLAAAIPIAELEANIGVASTFMVIPNSPIYDLKSEKEIRHIRTLVDLGHEIALHFDIGTTDNDLDPNDEIALAAAINVQCEMLADITREPVESVSFHRPLLSMLQGSDYVTGRVNAYAATLMECYRSDSKAAWQHGNPVIEFGNMEAQPVVQVLTHPIWWGESHLTGPERLEIFFSQRIHDLTIEDAAAFDKLLIDTVPNVTRAGRSAVA